MKAGEDIRFIDFHSHQGKISPQALVIKNLLAGDELPSYIPEGVFFSAGIHPWHLSKENMQSLKEALMKTLDHHCVIAVGEAGFDSLRGPSAEVQYDAFIFQAHVAEELAKPLVIHSVRSWDLLRRTKKEVQPSVKWIVHGFRGKSRLASDLVSEGFMLSLGLEGISPATIEAAGLHNIFLETDESGRDIREVYHHFIAVSGQGPDEVIETLKSNFNRILENEDF